jgi:hypothetical protein
VIFGSISNTPTDIELKPRATGDRSLAPPGIRQWPFISGPFGRQTPVLAARTMTDG